MTAPSSRWIWAVAALAVTAGAAGGVPGIRVAILRAAGSALVLEEPLEPADIAIIAIDAGGAGVLEAADLVHAGIVPRVAVFADPPDPVDREFVRRGVPYEDAAARAVRELRWLDVAAVEQIPTEVTGTESEGDVLPAWCARNDFRAILLISTPDHSRRLHRMLRRAMRGRRTKVIVRVARHAAFHPDRWWMTRTGVRTEIIELEKLLLDVIRHPLS
jgi:hypothetical protein